MGFLSQESRPMAPCILVHGLHGKGKTERAVKGGKPFVITTELKARNRVRKLNPQADGFFPENLVELEQLLEVLGSERFLGAGFDRVVLDSYTELTNALPDWIILRHSPGLKLDPGRLIEKQEYGPIMNWALAIVDALMLTGLPVIILCRSEIKEGATVLMSTGSSAKHLSSKVNATFEAVFDQELGHLWTSEPSATSPRCGLEEVPQKWNGPAAELLALIAGTSAPLAVAPPPAALTAAQEVDHGTGPGNAGAPGPAASSEPAPPTREEVKAAAYAAPAQTLGDVAANVREAQASAAPSVSQAASDFVDGVSPEVAKGEEIQALLLLCEEHREVDQSRLLHYLQIQGGVVPVPGRVPCYADLRPASVAAVIPILRDENRRRAFVAHLNNGRYSTPTPTPTA